MKQKRKWTQNSKLKYKPNEPNDFNKFMIRGDASNFRCQGHIFKHNNRKLIVQMNNDENLVGYCRLYSDWKSIFVDDSYKIMNSNTIGDR